MYSGFVPKFEIMCPECDHCFEPDEGLKEDLIEQLNLIDPKDEGSFAEAATEAGFVHEDRAIDEIEIPDNVWVQLWRDGLISCSSHVTMRDFLEMYA